MMLSDKDLLSVQEVRNLIKKSKNAQYALSQMSQEHIDAIVKAVANAGVANAESLAKIAVEETGFGIREDKVIKNLFGSKVVYEHIKDMKTIGVLKEDTAKKVIEVGVPVGVIAGLIPSTNPTSTVLYKSLISIKAGNSIIFSPHPNAKKCILETIKIIREAVTSVGGPEDIVTCMEMPTIQGTNELMKHKDVRLILATGGSAMVKAAYSSGTPAIGVGSGNGPAYIDKSADLSNAVKRILDSSTFDNGTICASEQSVVVERCMKEKVIAEFKKQGAYFLTPDEKEKVGRFIMRENGSMNPQIVGKSVKHIANLAMITVPTGARLLIGEETEIGHKVAFSREKLAPILGFYTADSMEKACDLCVEILLNEGAGHTCIIHAQDEDVIRYFGLRQPVSRFLVNTPAALGGIGGTTNLVPALTLGCGAVGNNSTSDNVGPMNLLNIRRIAYGVRELEDLRPHQATCNTQGGSGVTDDVVNVIIQKVLADLKHSNCIS
ncbi:acetaldehyde dehydrogenase (acetylating) [Brevibacillus laterosporus]|nr:acetaldehyde dehydrogenase (acetylating) [Brevibacillus laterosporus]RAP31207.1 Acetaldehyde dehydrogenase, ethanolamine utilization cluster [Brevibacillus laterosporus]TPG88832.1 acetaldehyde dehydrogenase (acetylating) [Brevibacillus laterosporus]